MVKVHQINGKIDLDRGEWSQLYVGNVQICRDLYHEYNLRGKKVTIRYYLSNNPINPDTVIEQFLKSFYGVLEVEQILLSGSEWTGVYGMDETFTVGGHSLMGELCNHEGKYCLLQIEVEI